MELIPRAWPYTAPVLNLTRCASRRRAAARAPGGGAYFTPAAEVVGDLGAILEELAPRLAGATSADWDVAAVDRWRRERRAALEVAVSGLAPHRVVQLARELTPEGAIATVDAGAHMFPTTAYWDAPSWANASSPTGWRPWASRCRRPSPPSSSIPIGAWCASPATAGS